MRHVLVHLLVFSLVVGLPTAGLADYQWIWERGEKKWLPQFELTARPGNNHLHGMDVDPLIPIAQDEKSMIYLNVRNALFWEHGDFSHEINAGGGYRRIMGDNAYILGGYGFYDRLDSRYDNVFNQGTLGLEAMAWNWDFRLNGYIADSDTKSAPGAGGPSVTLSGTSLTMKTMREQALSGLDAEVGWRIPFFGEDGVFSDMRVYAGGFFYDASKVSSIGGPAARFEARIWDVPFLPAESRVTLGANYRWDDERDSQVQGIVAVRVPLGRPNRSQPLTKLERRMTDRVVRDLAIVTNTGLGNKEAVMTRTGAEIDDVYFFMNQAMSDGSFEDPFSPEEVWGPTPAAGENDLLIALARGGDIYLNNVELMDGQTVLGGGMPLHVWGAESGQHAVWTAPGQAATIVGGFEENDAAFILADNNTIAGLFFEGGGEMEARPAGDGGGALGVGGSGYALELNLDGETTMADIYNNHFARMEHAIEVDVMGGSGLQMWVWDNYFEQMENGLHVWAVDDFDLRFDIHGNEFRNLGNGLDFALFPGGEGPSSFALDATDNLFADNDAGIVTYVSHNGPDYMHSSYIAGNRFWSNRYDDYELTIEGGDPEGAIEANVVVERNESLNGDSFVDIETDDPIWEGHLAFTVRENEVVGTAEGISIDVNHPAGGGPDVDVLIHENRIVGAWDGDAVEVDFYGTGSGNGNTVVITENWIENTFDDDGIDVSVVSSYDTDVMVAGNTVIDTGSSSSDNGIEIYLFETGSEGDRNTILVTGNTVEFVNGGGHNIEVEVGESADTDVTIAMNQLSNNDNGNGIDVYFAGVGSDAGNTIAITDNVIQDVDESGIEVDLRFLDNPDQMTTLMIARNDIDHTVDDEDGNGIQVDLYDVVAADITVTENSIDEADDGDNGNGIQIELDQSDGNTILIANNTIGRSGEHGIEIDLEGDSDGNTVTINQNEITLSDENGIDVWVAAGSEDNTVSISGNMISYVEDGIEITDFDGSTAVDSGATNVVTYCLGAPTDITGTTGSLDVTGGVGCP